MINNLKITPQQAIEIHKKANAGGSHRTVGAEYGVSKKTVYRYAHTPLEELERRAAEPAPPPRPAHRTHKATASQSKARKAVQDREERLADISVKVVHGQSRLRRGSLTITREGQQLQMDESGTLRRVLRCPVYSRRWRVKTFETVEVLSMDGGTGKARYFKLSGEPVHGEIRLTVKGKMVARVEFHPEDEDAVSAIVS